MVQIYQVGNTTYTKNGDAVIFPYSCDLSVELNGAWVLTLLAPIDNEGRWKFITEEAVIKVKTWQDDEQLYRIERVDKTDFSVSATAYPIFMDSGKSCFLMDVRPTNKTGQEALNLMLSGSGFTGSSDIATRKTAYFVRRNFMDALNGSASPTFIGTWGGEILYNNKSVTVNERVGGDYGVEARYGRNINGINYSVDMSTVVTRIVPVAYNGYKMSGNSPWVNSSKINNYALIYTREVHYENIRMAQDANGDVQDDWIICNNQTELNTALTAAANADFAAGCDLPTVTIDINMDVVPSEYADMEKVRLGDTIRCRHQKLDLTTTARVIALTWDCVRKKVKAVTIGDYKYNYVATVSDMMRRVESGITKEGSVVAEQVKGFLDGANAQFHTQYDLAEQQDVLAILFENLDPNSSMYGALGIGTQGLCISKTRTADGRDWVWTTGITANGMNASMGVFGILADKLGLNYINLDTGEISFAGSAMLGGQTATQMQQNTATALSTANSAATAAANAQQAAIDGSKTATNYLYYNASTGLVISTTGQASTGYNTQITSGGIYFRNGSTNMGYINGTNFRLYHPGANTLAMSLAASSLTFYETDGTTQAAQIGANGLLVKEGMIGGFYITNSSNQGTTANGGHFYASSLYRHTDDGEDYEYEAGMAGQSSTTNVAFYVRRIARGATWTTANSTLMFYVNNAGKLYAQNAEITGAITATSLTLGTGVTVPYSKVSGTPDLTVYVAKDGTIGNTPAEGSTGFVVSSAGLLKASNAIIYGTLYSSAGLIGGWTLGSNALSSTYTSGSTVYRVGINSMNSSGNENRAAFFVGKKEGADDETYPFYVNYSGRMGATNAKISGEITAISGGIGGFEITATAVKTRDVPVTSNADNSIALSSADFTRTINGTSRSGLRFAMGDKFGVTGDGAIYASSATISGAITATSLSLGTGVTIPYSKISSTPDLTVYVAKDGTIGSTPASGSTGFVVSSAGLLQASNAIIYGTIYASAGLIGGWTIDSQKLQSRYDVSSTESYRATVQSWSGSTTTRIAFAVAHETNDTTEYPFRVNYSGALTATNATITGAITATSGRIGSATQGWEITSDRIRSSYTSGDTVYRVDVASMGSSTDPASRDAFLVRTSTDGGSTWTYPFGVRYNGHMWANDITANGGSIGGFHITSSSVNNQGKTSANGGHRYTTSLYRHSGDGTTYEYEVGIKGDAPENPSSADTGYSQRAFYIIRIQKGKTWTAENETPIFYVTHGGKLYAQDAEITGAITATSLTLGTGVTVPYSKVSGKPDLTVYVAKDGTIGSTPADGVTGFKVSSAGLLQASNAVIYGTVYASAGKIANWEITGNQIRSGYSTSTDAYQVLLQAMGTSTNPSTRDAILVRKSTDGGSTWTSWPFMLKYDGTLTATNATITGTINARSGTFGAANATKKITIGTNSTNASIYYGMSSLASTSNGFYLGTDGIALGGGKFKVTADGTLNAQTGYIGQFEISGDAGAKYLNGVGTDEYGNQYLARMSAPTDVGGNDWVFQTAVKWDGTSVWNNMMHITAAGKVYATDFYVAMMGASGTTYTAVSVEGHTHRLITNVGGNGMRIADDTVSIVPYYNGSSTASTSTGKINIGTTNNRFLCIYLKNAPDVSSDRNQKTGIQVFDRRHEEAYMDLLPISYKWKAEGHDRRHYGFIAQDVEAAFNSHGISTEDLGFVCVGEDNSYSLRYSEIIALNTHMIQKLYKRIAQLERQLAEMSV